MYCNVEAGRMSCAATAGVDMSGEWIVLWWLAGGKGNEDKTRNVPFFKLCSLCFLTGSGTAKVICVASFLVLNRTWKLADKWEP